MLIQQYAKDLNYNLMWRNSNNTLRWTEYLKSRQIVRFLQVAERIATSSNSVWRIHIDTQPQDQFYALSVYMLFHFMIYD